jgi:hypothetical protein
LENIYILLFTFLLLWYFIYLRKIAECARVQAKRYCENEGIQFITIARQSSKLRFNKQLGFYWLSIFQLDFSGDGQSSYHGTVTMHGLKLAHVDLPPYRIQ